MHKKNDRIRIIFLSIFYPPSDEVGARGIDVAPDVVIRLSAFCFRSRSRMDFFNFAHTHP